MYGKLRTCIQCGRRRPRVELQSPPRWVGKANELYCHEGCGYPEAVQVLDEVVVPSRLSRRDQLALEAQLDEAELIEVIVLEYKRLPIGYAYVEMNRLRVLYEHYLALAVVEGKVAIKRLTGYRVTKRPLALKLAATMLAYMPAGDYDAFQRA
jgi:hypothetical protein